MDSLHRNHMPREGEAVTDSGRAYEERVKSAAFKSKHGYSGTAKNEDCGMPTPMHMRSRR